jgi:hypothetical protein
MWLAMLLGNGKHPFSNATIVPEEIVTRCATGVMMADGKPYVARDALRSPCYRLD